MDGKHTAVHPIYSYKKNPDNPEKRIIDEETFQTAQKLRKTGRRLTSLSEANPMTGLRETV